ncbi:MAG: hypothetical protein H6522_11750 [Mycolicibacterium sp.]|nr:hypothetical protein [Mycolicibacterium sp.]
MPGELLVATAAVDDEDTAREALAAWVPAHAVYLFDAKGNADRLLVASGGGTAAVAGAVQDLHQVSAAQQRTVTVDDVVPLLPAAICRGMSGSHLVIGWVVAATCSPRC